jgi:hypothetical protein
LRDACRAAFKRDESNYHLAEIYLVLWASIGFQGIRQNIAPSLLCHLQKKWSIRDFLSKEEQDLTQMALSLNRRIRVNKRGTRISPSVDGGVSTVALIESIVPHPECFTYWKLRVSFPDLGWLLIEYTEPLDLVLELISTHY